MCYIAWRWWECFMFQGADATYSPFKNFFQYRLSPFVSGCVYVAYSYYLIETLAHHNKVSCYPNCWRNTFIGRVGLALFGTAFSIACLTQLLNAFTKKWHPEINWRRCNKIEKWLLLVFGHVGFVGRAGLFLFVSVLMFRAFRDPVPEGGNTIANGINQFVDTQVGRGFMYIVGSVTVVYGVFALLCTRYRFFPTPPPSGIPLFSRLHVQQGMEMRGSVIINNKTGTVVYSKNPKYRVGEKVDANALEADDTVVVDNPVEEPKGHTEILSPKGKGIDVVD